MLTKSGKATKEFLSFDFELKESDDAKGRIEGYGSVFGNVDSYGDVVEKGAFRKSLAKRTPSLLLHHDMRRPVGVWEEVREDDKGLFVRGALNMEVQESREAYHLAKQGALKGLSIGYYVTDWEMRNGVRYLKEIELLEVSLVTIAANERAALTGVKSTLPQTEREFEAALREMGYGQKQAKAIVAQGFKGFLAMQRDAAPKPAIVQRDVDELLESLKSLNQTLKG